MLHRAQPQDENKKSVHLVSAPEASGKKTRDCRVEKDP